MNEGNTFKTIVVQTDSNDPVYNIATFSGAIQSEISQDNDKEIVWVYRVVPDTETRSLSLAVEFVSEIRKLNRE